MGMIRYCDGCGDSWKVDPNVTATPSNPVMQLERINGMGGGGLPDPGREVHWCLECAQIAFAAVKAAHAATGQRERLELAKAKLRSPGGGLSDPA